jgi:hypothetical protein
MLHACGFHFLPLGKLYIAWVDVDIGVLAEFPELLYHEPDMDAGERGRSVAN